MRAIPTPILVAGGAVLAALAWVRIQGGAAGAGQAIGQGAVDLVTGVVKGIDQALPEPIRPSSDQNMAYQSVNAIGGAISGQGSAWTLGGWIYDITHPDPMK